MKLIQEEIEQVEYHYRRKIMVRNLYILEVDSCVEKREIKMEDFILLDLLEREVARYTQRMYKEDKL